MIRTKNERLILVISSIISIVLALLILVLSIFIKEVKWTWLFSVLIGQAVSIGCFFKSNAIITKVLEDDLSSAKGLLVFNNVLGMLCYLICLVINFLIPGLNIFVNAIGILLIKFTTFFVGSISKSE